MEPRNPETLWGALYSSRTAVARQITAALASF
jgi:hypothetical protein